MPQLSMAALQPVSATGTTGAGSAARSASLRPAEPPERVAGRGPGNDPESGSRSPSERAAGPDHERDTAPESERPASAGKPDRAPRAEQAGAAADGSTVAQRKAVGADEQPFADLLAAHLVEPADATPVEDLITTLPAATVAATQADLPPGGNGLPPAALGEALNRHAATLVGNATTTGAAIDVPAAVAAAGEKSGGARIAAELSLPAAASATPASAEAHTAGGPPALATLAPSVAGASTAAAQPLPGVATAVDAPLGDARWSQAFSERVSWLVRDGSQLATMRLDPPQLGPVEVRLSLNNGEASIHFVSSHPPVREAIEAALPRLREMLGEQGLVLGDVDVSGRDARGETDGRAETAQRTHAARHEGQQEADVAGGERARPREGLLDHYA